MEKSKKLILGISTSYIHSILNIGVNLALVPIILSSIGKLEYGIWITILSIVGYMGLLDFGVATATSKFLSENNTPNLPEAKKIISNSFTVYSIIASIVVVITVFLSFFLMRFFDIREDLLSISSIVFLLAGLNMALSFPSNVFGSVLFGFKDFFSFNIINILGVIVNAILTIVLLKMGFGIMSLAVVLLLTTFFVLFLRVVYLKKTMPDLFSNLWGFDRTIFFKILSFSGFMLVLSLGGQIVFNTDSIIIAKFLGISSVATYAIAFRMTQATTTFTYKISDAFFPFFSEFHSSKNKDKFVLFLFESTKFSIGLATILFLILIFLGKDIIGLWVGSQNFVGNLIFYFMALVALMGSIIRPGVMALKGMGKLKKIVLFNILEAFLNLFFSIFLVLKFGLFGVILGTFLAMFVTSFWLVPFTVCREGQISFKKYFFETIFMPILLGVCLMLPFLFFNFGMINNNWLIIIIKAMLLSIIYLFLFAFLCINKERRLFYMEKLRCFLLKKAIF